MSDVEEATCLLNGGQPIDPEPEPEPVTRPLIYGGEGHGSADVRQLVCIQPLADRSAMSFKERVIILDSDVREAMALAARRLDRIATEKYSNQGFTWNLYDIHYDMGGRRIITATLRISRNGA